MVAGKVSTQTRLDFDVHTLHVMTPRTCLRSVTVEESRTSKGRRNACIRVHQQQSDLRRAVSNWKGSEANQLPNKKTVHNLPMTITTPLWLTCIHPSTDGRRLGRDLVHMGVWILFNLLTIALVGSPCDLVCIPWSQVWMVVLVLGCCAADRHQCQRHTYGSGCQGSRDLFDHEPAYRNITLHTSSHCCILMFGLTSPRHTTSKAV